jgi:transposase
VFIDESGVNLSLTRAEARAPRGERIVDDVPGSRWETYTIIAALRDTGVIAPMVLRGAMNAEALRTWVQLSLAPQLKPWDIVIWDNLSIHNCPEIADIVRGRGARLEFLPPYSPDLNPIELAWSKMKTILRRLKARATEVLIDAVGYALRAVTAEDCVGWFNHAGYTFS